MDVGDLLSKAIQKEIDEKWLAIAAVASEDARCLRRTVGAVLVSDEQICVARGSNSMSAGSCLKGDCPRGTLSQSECAAYSSYDTGPGMCHAVHAEVQAILKCPEELRRRCTMYVTDAPCNGCWNVIKHVGIRRVVWP